MDLFKQKEKSEEIEQVEEKVKIEETHPEALAKDQELEDNGETT